MWRLLLWPVYAPVEETGLDRSAPRSRPRARRGEHRRTAPTGDELIPSSREAPYISTPDGRIREVWTSPNDHGFVFRDAADRAGAAALDREVDALLDGLPDRVRPPLLVRL